MKIYIKKAKLAFERDYISHYFKNKKIAVVGNAESLLFQKYGEIIDSFDVVCRFNSGNLPSCIEAQGTKVDVSFVSVPDLYPEVVKKYSHIVQVSPRERNNHYDAIPLRYIENLKKKMNVDRPSSGIIALYYLYQQKSNVTIFGFDFKQTPTYYDKNRTHEPHDYVKEALFFKTYLSKRMKMFEDF